MKIVGLTGGIGSGKSTVLKQFEDLGINTYCADKVAKKLINSDEDLIVKKLPFEEVYQMVLKGEITDSMSIMGVLKVKLLIDNNHI